MNKLAVCRLLILLPLAVPAKSQARQQPGQGDSLVHALQSDDSITAKQAVAELSRLGPPAVPLLLAFIEEEKAEVMSGRSTLREVARAALRQEVIMSLSQIDALGRKLQDDLRNAERAVEALKGIGEPAIDALLGLLEVLDSVPRLRVAVIASLGGVRAVRAVEPLIGLLSNENEDIRIVAGLALEQITGHDLGKDPARWRAWWANQPRRPE